MVKNEFCSNNQRKKQVRFNTSLKMASSASDHQLPRPLTDIQNLEKRSYRCGESIGPEFSKILTKSGKPFFNNSSYPPLQSRTVELPKPSVDLELSILDSSDVGKGATLGRSKIYQNDTPYCFSPSMMPLQSVYKPTQSEKLFSFSPGMVSSAAQSKKEFPTEKSDANPGLGFFTQPYSAGLYQDKKVPIRPRDVANRSDRVPCNENLCQMPNDHAFNQNSQPMYNNFNCCSNSNTRNTRPACCSCVQNGCQHKEDNICKKSETIVDSLEMKRRAIHARQNKCKGEENALTNEYNNEIEQDIIARNKSDEPTVSDLYEIIKLQNKQLQMLQQRVDLLLTVKESNIDAGKLQDVERTKLSTNGVIEPVSAEVNDAVNVSCREHISIGVMTSFELVMSSNYINKRSVTFNPQANVLERRKDVCVQTTQNISGVAIAGSQDLAISPAIEHGVNFLDGLTPYNKPCSSAEGLVLVSKTPTKIMTDDRVQMDKINPKTSRKTIARVHINENLPVPEYAGESLNESENERSRPNIGWTFYNNVMNRVNNILHSPTNADRTPTGNMRDHITMAQNQHRVTTAKRVTLDPSPAPANLCRYDSPSSDLSLHMRQLATKYNIAPPSAPCLRRETVQPQFQVFGGDVKNEMSLATMQHMQKYQLLSMTNDEHQQQMAYDRGGAHYDRRSPQNLKPAYKNPSRILDITTLKQQSKLL